MIYACKKCKFSTQYKSIYAMHLLSKEHYKSIDAECVRGFIKLSKK